MRLCRVLKVLFFSDDIGFTLKVNFNNSIFSAAILAKSLFFLRAVL